MKRRNLAIFAVGCGLCQQPGDCRASKQPQHEVNHVPHSPCVSRFKTHVTADKYKSILLWELLLRAVRYTRVRLRQVRLRKSEESAYHFMSTPPRQILIL